MTDQHKIIDGKAFATDLRGRLRIAVDAIKTKHGVTPGLSVVLVGEDPASEIYVRNKGRQTLEAGMNSTEHRLPINTTQAELLAKVEELNNDETVHGILVQLPLPPQLDAASVIGTIRAEKDVDGFHVINAGKLATGDPSALVPCTPLGCLMLLQDRLGDLSGQHALIVGRSNIVGKPMSQLLLGANCTVCIGHSRSRNLPELCSQADIIVAAVGRPEMIKGDWIKPGATVIDVGINRIAGDDGKTRVVGDVEFSSAIKNAGAITPVPGGVGPMTIAVLLRNTLVAACEIHKIECPDF